MRRKGQVSNFDLVIAVGIFMFILFFMMGSWDEMSRKIYNFEDRRAAYYKGMDVADILVKTAGNPPNWDGFTVVDKSTVSALGLASEPNVLDRKKLERLEALDHEEVKELLGLSREDFNLEVYNIEGTDELEEYSFGSDIDNPHVRIDRYAILDGDMVRVSIKVYY